MMLSSQIQVLRQWVVDAIADSDLEAVPLDRVVWSPRDFPDRGYPYVLIFYTGAVTLGLSPAQRVDESDNLVTRTGKNTTISITFVSQPADAAPTLVQMASSYLREVSIRTKSFVAEPLRLADMAVGDINETPNVDRLQGRSQWESRAVLDITFGHALEVLEQPGTIETVEVTGATTPATSPTGPQTIPAP